MTLAVMLDKGGAFTTLDPTDTTIWWGAYVGMPQQALIHGPLAEVAEEVRVDKGPLKTKLRHFCMVEGRRGG